MGSSMAFKSGMEAKQGGTGGEPVLRWPPENSRPVRGAAGRQMQGRGAAGRQMQGRGTDGRADAVEGAARGEGSRAVLWEKTRRTTATFVRCVGGLPRRGRLDNGGRGDGPATARCGAAQPRRAPGCHGEMRGGPATARCGAAQPRRDAGRPGTRRARGQPGRCLFFI
jgi:hypothetical protein